MAVPDSLSGKNDVIIVHAAVCISVKLVESGPAVFGQRSA